MRKLHSRLAISVSFFTMGLFPASGQEYINIGIFTDNQYCNCAVEGVRNYPASLDKLDSVIRFFNASKVDAIFHLGDMIDHNFSSYDSVIPRYRRSVIPVNYVLGNHDYAVGAAMKEKVLPMLGLSSGNYTKIIGNWEFIILNGDDLSYFAPQTKTQKQERNTMVSDLASGVRKNIMPWNGGISQLQMNWFNNQLLESQTSGRNVIVLCHFPVYPASSYNLWNDQELIHLMTRYPCIKAYFNGHYHRGSYGFAYGIHFVNFKGMVNTKETAYAIVSISTDSILINGYGREPDRKLKIGTAPSAVIRN
jgi:hypothetical protein